MAAMTSKILVADDSHHMRSAIRVVWVESVSRGLLDHLVRKSLPLFAAQEFEEPRQGLQERRGSTMSRFAPASKVRADRGVVRWRGTARNEQWPFVMRGAHF